MPGALGLALRKLAVSGAARRVRPERRLRPERRAAASAQDPDRRQRRHRRQLPARRQGRQQSRASRSAAACSSGRNTILSCKNGDIEIARRRQHRLQLRDLLGQPRAHRRATRCSPPTATSSAAITTSAIRRRRCSSRARTSAGVAVGAGAWLGAGAKILDGVTIGDRADRRRRRRRARGGAADGAIAVGVPGAGRRHARRVAAGERRSAERERARRKLNVLQVCDHLGWEGSRMHGVKRLFAWMIPALRSGALQRLARQPAQEGPVGRDARVARHRHHVPAQVEVRSGDAAGAAEGHRSQADRHPAPARLRRDDVRAAGRRRCAGCRRSCTSTRT